MRQSFASTRHSMRALLACAVAAGQAACPGDESLGAAGLRSPAALVAVGDSVWLVDQARGALHIVDLAEPLAKTVAAPAPARYFPLHLPAGPQPQALAATADDTLVVALDGRDGGLRAFDVAGRVPLATADGAESWRPADGGAFAASLAASDQGKLYVGYADLHRVAVVEVKRVDGARAGEAVAEWRLARWVASPIAVDSMVVAAGPAAWATGGATAPEQLVVANLAGEVARIQLADGGPDRVTERWSVGSAAGPLAVAAEGRILVVARPAFSDLVAYDLGQGAAPIDVDGALTPLPRALLPCAPADGAAPGPTAVHPADAELCLPLLGDGAAAPARQPYVGAYLGSPPRHLVALAGVDLPDVPDRPLLSAALAVVCADGRLRVVTFVIDGGIKAILTGEPPAKPTAEVLPAAPSAAEPGLKVLSAIPGRGALAATDVLAPLTGRLAPSFPRRRLRLAADDTVGVLGGGLRELGNYKSMRLSLRWEGIIQPSGQGQPLQDRRRFQDARAVYAGRVRPNDLLEILTPPTPQASGQPTCRTEFVIAAVGRDTLDLADPLTEDCWGTGRALNYQVRVGDAFVVQRQLSSTPIASATASAAPAVGRLGRGDVLLPSAAAPWPYTPNLAAVRPAAGSSEADDDAGARQGSSAGDLGMPLILRVRADLPAAATVRDAGLILELHDESAILTVGDRPAAAFGSVQPPGRLPAGMALARASEDDARAVVVVSYVADDTLLLAPSRGLPAAADRGVQGVQLLR